MHERVEPVEQRLGHLQGHVQHLDVRRAEVRVQARAVRLDDLGRHPADVRDRAGAHAELQHRDEQADQQARVHYELALVCGAAVVHLRLHAHDAADRAEAGRGLEHALEDVPALDGAGALQLVQHHRTGVRVAHVAHDLHLGLPVRVLCVPLGRVGALGGEQADDDHQPGDPVQGCRREAQDPSERNLRVG